MMRKTVAAPSLCTIVALMLVLCVHGTAIAAMINFDFDDIGWLATDDVISDYMTNLYGPFGAITVENSLIDNGGVLELLYDYDGDQYLQNIRAGRTTPKNSLGEYFTITFMDTPISCMTLDLAAQNIPAGLSVYAATSGGPFVLIPELFTANNTVREDVTHNFAAPVWQLKFVGDLNNTTDDSGEIKIDDLRVNPIPEPGTLLLLGTGLAGFAGLKLRRRKRT